MIIVKGEGQIFRYFTTAR